MPLWRAGVCIKDYEINLISFAIGLAVGMFGGLIGLGGGLIMIPLMISVLKLSRHQAHGTSLVAFIFTGVSVAFIYGLRGNIHLLAVAMLSLTAIMTARGGTFC